MNKVFKVIWNHATQTWTAVSELGHAKGKTKSKKIVKLTALAGAVIGSLAVSQTATAGSDLNNTNESIQLWPKDLAHPTAGRHAIAIGINANASHQDSIAIGQNSQSNWTNSIAIGRDTQSAKDHTVAIGSNATATGYQAVTLGSYSNATDRLTIAVGAKANATKESAIAVGASASATNDNAVALGQTATASNNNAIAIGTKEVTSGNNAVGIGAYAESTAERSTAVGMMSQANGAGSFAGGASAQATGTNSVAIGGATDGTLANKAGTAAKATGAQSIAIGTKSKAIDEDTIAQGNTATANKESDIAIGTSSVANGTSTKPAPETRPNKSIPDERGVGSAIAMGKNANAIGVSTIAVGQGAKASFDNATAIGLEAKASQEDAIAMGSQSNATAASSIAIGTQASATGANATAIGLSAKALEKDTLALGTGASATAAYSVALGVGSVAADTYEQVNSATVGDYTFGGFAGNNSKLGTGAVVSVGDAEYERQIQNVAAGRITKESTDAINGSQLYAVAEKLGKGWNLKTKKEAGESTEATENIAPDENVTLLAGKNIKLTQTKGNVVIATKNDVFFDTANIGGININTGGIQMNNQKITGLRAGEVNATSQDAVNGSQLYTNPFVFQGFNGNNTGTGDQVASDYVYRPGMAGNAPLQLVALNGLKMTANPNSNNTYKLEIDTESDIYKGLKGQDGKDGKDGKSVTATVTNNNNGTHTLTVTNGDGSTTTTILKDGAKGDTGDAGPAGARGSTIEVTVDDDDKNGTHTIKFTDMDSGSVTTTIVKDGKNGKDGKDGAAGAKGEKGDTGAAGAKGEKGDKGDSITGEVVDNGDGTHTITITNEGDGSVTTTIVKDGKDGKDGVDGKNAKADVKDNGNGTHTVTITDGEGNTTTTIVKDGTAAAKGDTGENGKSAEGKVERDEAKGTSTITINNFDKDGKVISTTTATVKDGKDGKDGKDADGTFGLVDETGTTDGSISKKLNNTIQIKGDAGTKVQVFDKATGKTSEKEVQNIFVKKDGDALKVSLNPDLTVNSVTTNELKAGPVTINQGGIDAGNTTIKNVAPGKNGTDAVNVDQLNQKFGDVNSNVNKVDNNARAGVAQALATAGLPQAYLPGKSMLAIGGGHYRGETGYAVGFSSISDGGNWIIKGTASGNSRGHFGATAAVGYQW